MRSTNIKRPKIKRPGLDNTPSKQLFELVLAYKNKPQPLTDESYCELIKAFFEQLLLLYAKHELAADREGVYGHDDPFIMNVIMTEALRDPAVLSNDEREYIQSIFLDNRFFILLSLIGSWGTGSDSKSLCEHFIDIPGMKPDENLLTVARVCKNLFEMISIQYGEYGHWGYDLLSILTSQIPYHITRLHYFNIYNRTQSYVEFLLKYIDCKTCEYDIKDNELRVRKKSPEFVQKAKDFADSYLPFIVRLHKLVGGVVKHQLYDATFTVVQHILTVEAAYHSYVTGSEIEHDISHGQTLESIIYNDLFSSESILRQYDIAELESFFYHLLYTLHSISEGFSSHHVKTDLANTYAGADADTFNDIRKTRMLESLREAYFILLGTTSAACDLSAVARQLAEKYMSHALILNEIRSLDSDTASFASLQSHHSQLDDLSRKFYAGLSDQRQHNANTDKNLRIYRKLLSQGYRDYRAFMYSIRHDDFFRKSLEEIKPTPDMENKKFRNNLRRLIVSYKQKINTINRDSVLSIEEKREAIFNLLSIPAKKLFDAFIGDVTKGLHIDIRYRLYLDALQLAKATYKKDLVNISKAQSLDMVRQSELVQQRAASHHVDIAALKATYNINEQALKNLEASIPVIDSEVEFNEQCELEISAARDDIVAVTATRLIDTENRRGWFRYNRDHCLRQESDYQHSGMALAERLNSHTNDISYRRIIGQYDPSVGASLRRERRKQIKLSNEQNRRNWRYAGFATLGVVGIAGLALATASTLGLIHLTWVLPTIYFAAGGSVGGIGLFGLILNKPGRYQAIRGYLGKGVDAIKSVFKGSSRLEQRVVRSSTPVQAVKHDHERSGSPKANRRLTDISRQASLRAQRSQLVQPIRMTREAGDKPILPLPEFKRNVVDQAERAEKIQEKVTADFQRVRANEQTTLRRVSSLTDMWQQPVDRHNNDAGDMVLGL